MSLASSGQPAGPLWRGLFAGRAPEARFQHLLEQVPGAVLLVAPRSGQVLAVNSRAAAYTGWTREELLTRSLAEVFTQPETLDLFYLLEPGSTRTYPEMPLRTRFGHQLVVDARLSAFQEGQVTVVFVLATLAEDRLQSERDRARHNSMLVNLHRLAGLLEDPTPATRASAAQETAHGLFADAAGLYLAASGSPSLELAAPFQLPASFPAIIGPSEAHWLQAPYSWNSAQRGDGFLPQAFRGAGFTHILAYPLGRPPDIGGALLIAFRPGNPPAPATAAFLEAAAGYVTQLEAQIRRQERLQDAQRLATLLSGQQDAILAHVTEGVVILDARGAVDGLSSAAARMLGYRPEELVGLPHADALCADDTASETLQAVLAGAHPRGLVREAQLHRRSGEQFPVILHMRPLAGAGAVVVIHDLTRERADEVQRQQADHLAYAGQSIQAFAHEVRAPLNNIGMGVQFLAARLPAEDATVTTALAKIQSEVTRLSALMNDMLAWAKPLEPQLQPVEVTVLLRRLLTRWNTKLQQRNIAQAFTAPESLPPVQADYMLIERVFVNLIENALQAMPAGGLLALALAVADRPPQGRVLEVRVSDSGPGIPEDLRRRIFDPYFTTKADGTGLGLAIAKRIVTVHRGAIACESYPGAGTIFTITLPIPAESAPETETIA